MLGHLAACPTRLGQSILVWSRPAASQLLWHPGHCSLGTPPYGIPAVPAPGDHPSSPPSIPACPLTHCLLPPCVPTSLAMPVWGLS